MRNEQLARELGKIETTLESLKAGQETLHRRIDKLSAKIDEMPEKRQKLKRYSLSMAKERMKKARKADRDGRYEEAIGWYGGAVWFLNRYWPNRAAVVGDRMDELRLVLTGETEHYKLL